MMINATRSKMYKTKNDDERLLPTNRRYRCDGRVDNNNNNNNDDDDENDVFLKMHKVDRRLWRYESNDDATTPERRRRKISKRKRINENGNSIYADDDVSMTEEEGEDYSRGLRFKKQRTTGRYDGDDDANKTIFSYMLRIDKIFFYQNLSRHVDFYTNVKTLRLVCKSWNDWLSLPERWESRIDAWSVVEDDDEPREDKIITDDRALTIDYASKYGTVPIVPMMRAFFYVVGLRVRTNDDAKCVVLNDASTRWIHRALVPYGSDLTSFVLKFATRLYDSRRNDFKPRQKKEEEDAIDRNRWRSLLRSTSGTTDTVSMIPDTRRCVFSFDFLRYNVLEALKMLNKTMVVNVMTDAVPNPMKKTTNAASAYDAHLFITKNVSFIFEKIPLLFMTTTTTTNNNANTTYLNAISKWNKYIVSSSSKKNRKRVVNEGNDEEEEYKKLKNRHGWCFFWMYDEELSGDDGSLGFEALKRFEDEPSRRNAESSSPRFRRCKLLEYVRTARNDSDEVISKIVEQFKTFDEKDCQNDAESSELNMGNVLRHFEILSRIALTRSNRKCRIVANDDGRCSDDVPRDFKTLYFAPLVWAVEGLINNTDDVRWVSMLVKILYTFMNVYSCRDKNVERASVDDVQTKFMLRCLPSVIEKTQRIMVKYSAASNDRRDRSVLDVQTSEMMASHLSVLRNNEIIANAIKDIGETITSRICDMRSQMISCRTNGDDDDTKTKRFLTIRNKFDVCKYMLDFMKMFLKNPTALNEKTFVE